MSLHAAHAYSTAPMSLPKPAAPRTVSRELESEALLAGNTCIAIRHGKDVYWLRSTRQGKLLLTK